MRPSRVLNPVREFLGAEATGAVVLVGAVLVALVWANGPWSASYHDVWHATLTVGTGRFAISEDLQHWVNDGLMAFFFFVVGLEIKRELVRGELRDPRKAAVPAIAALGGMVVPPLVFLAWNAGGDAHGWGIPMATDIALAVGVVGLMSRHAPPPLRLFLLTLAIVDDIGAIAVIALFYSGEIAPLWLLTAVAGVALIVVARRWFASPLLYVPLALGVWIATYESGVHATIAGVALGLVTPAGAVRGREVIESLEHRLHPFSSYLVVPVFALANAGVELSRHAVGSAVSSRVGLGIFTGLVVGKPAGVIGAALVGTAFGLRLPDGLRRPHLVAAGIIAGIGFTVSLFVAELAFRASATLDDARIAVLLASCVAGVAGVGLLWALRSRPMATIALVDDLMDRSRITSALPTVTFVTSPADCADADVVLIDLARHVAAVAAVRAAAPTARIVCFGPHVDEAAATTAREAGADDVLARSRFFHDPAAALDGS